MGISHTCHVSNDSKETVKIVVTDFENRNSTAVLAPKHVRKFPMRKWALGTRGSTTVFVYRRTDYGSWTEKEEACCTGVTYTNYIIDHGPDNTLGIWHAKYGTLHDKSGQLQ